jgi:hypothetical protein
MKRRRNFWRGVRVSCGGVLGAAAISLVYSYLFYDGKCGGLMPFIGGPRPCSFWDYASSDLILFGIGFSPILLVIVFIPPLVGYLLDRRGQASV